ncbi:uncharacterized protein LOC111014690 isoform X2 [Momordica charantia]|uniref:Uncharacterized protein LOC111014690 isoform X2 n=1 Tax=Momordica charantia TaxID=3673 RepID=A0A6J1CTR6_MOMCH|nr:uncharacterized protein LOC111014690 isoform X2 [Momordica charantia]
MADEISSAGTGDGFNRRFSAAENPQFPLQPIDSASEISTDENKFPSIASNQKQDFEVMINGKNSASGFSANVFHCAAEENPEITETSVEKMVVCDSASENGGSITSLVDEVRNLDSGLEIEKESSKVDDVRHFETFDAVEDGNQEVAVDEVEEKDFARSMPSLDRNQDFAKKELVQEVQLSAAIEADGKEAFARSEELLRKEAASASFLEMKKKLLLEELEAMLVLEEKGKNPPNSEGIVDNCSMIPIVKGKIADQQNVSENMNVLRRSNLSLRNSLKIEVIDETALVEPVHVSEIGNGEEMGIVCPSRSMQIKLNKYVEPEKGGKKAKRSRRRAREAKIPEIHGKLWNVNELDKFNARQKNMEGNKIVYSRKDMEALRFVNVAEQRRLWKAICKELMPVVAREYSSLTSSNSQMKIGSTSDSKQHLEKRDEASSIIREGCSESLDGEIEDMEGDSEIKNFVSSDPSCSLSVSEDGNTILDECSGDSDDDKYYHSIQRPAFLVEGEPDFDSGPPEDGLEYLRRVRWEASRIPNVTVAKVDTSNLKKEQSVYMPVIPAIADCPQHLLPSKQWEDAFLADFSQLRQALSQSEGFIQSDFILHEKIDLISPNLIDQPSVLPANNIDSQQPEKPIANTIAKESNCMDHPSVSAISKMSSVFRVSSLRKRINLILVLLSGACFGNVLACGPRRPSSMTR